MAFQNIPSLPSKDGPLIPQIIQQIFQHTHGMLSNRGLNRVPPRQAIAYPLRESKHVIPPWSCEQGSFDQHFGKFLHSSTGEGRATESVILKFVTLGTRYEHRREACMNKLKFYEYENMEDFFYQTQ